MTSNNLVHVMYFVVLFLNFSSLSGELFSATEQIKSLFETRRGVVDGLEDYVHRELKRLNVLKKYLEHFEKNHKNGMHDVGRHFENPINCYMLVKKLTVDLEFIEKYIKDRTVYESDTNMIYPTREDLEGAAIGLKRLQVTYSMNASELANGKLNFSVTMSADDCYEMGLVMYTEYDYKNGVAWMLEALRKYRTEVERVYTFSQADIENYITAAYYHLEDFKIGLLWTQELIALKPKDYRSEELKHLVLYYRNKLATEEKLAKGQYGLGNQHEVDEAEVMFEEIIKDDIGDKKMLSKTCSGESVLPIKITTRLKCRYLTEQHPFLKLAPIKLEQLYLKPEIVLLHEVMSEDEIQHVKDITKPKLQRTLLLSEVTEKPAPSRFRVSQSTWLADNESRVIERITRRISHFTGLSMVSAEHLYVANYGIGGHYDQHHDFIPRQDEWMLGPEGNRIATVLFYMSDVAQGGATVFTKLGLTVFPVKRAALFWMNLQPSGEGDDATLHAACPVLRGSKWVANKWIHILGQEFLRPCNLEYQKGTHVNTPLQSTGLPSTVAGRLIKKYLPDY